MCKVYGYCRISTKQQSIDRQERNIKAVYPDAIITKEAFTGTKLDGRTGWQRIQKAAKSGDTIVFDSVSRMSRNAQEGVDLYMELYERGVQLVFLKEPYINTATYKAAMKETVPMTGTAVDYILQGVNQYMKELAKQQVRQAFDQAEKEVMDLRQRTKEGIQTAKLNGKQIGQLTGKKLTTKKETAAIEIIRKHSKDFEGTLNDTECAKLAGISRNSFYKYKRIIRESMAE